MTTHQETYQKLIDVEKQISKGEILEREIASAVTQGWIALVIGVILVIVAVMFNLGFIGNILLLAIGLAASIGGVVRAIRANSQKWEIARAMADYKAKRAEYQLQLTMPE